MTLSDASVRRWQVPSVHPEPTPEPVRLTVERIEALEAEVRESAWNAGFEEGMRAGEDAVNTRIQHLDHILTYLADPLRSIEPVVEEALLTLSLSFVEAVVGASTTVNGSLLERVLREALEALPDPSRKATVFLSPADYEQFSEVLLDRVSGRPWEAKEDKNLDAGDVRVEAGLSEVDGRKRTMLRQLFSTVVPGFVEPTDGESVESNPQAEHLP